MVLRQQLITFIQECTGETVVDLRDDTSLIISGLIDSLALFELATWIEAQVGSEIDLTAFDLSTEWDTIGNIIDFIEKNTESIDAVNAK